MASVWLRRATDRTEAEQRVLRQLLELCPDTRLAFGLTERFLQLVRERQANVLDVWLEDAAAAGLPEFRSFATGLQRDKRRLWQPCPCPTATAKQRASSPNSNS